LTVETKATVERVLIENEVAKGVVYHQNGQSIQVEAAKEVILSAGAYNSPQILMLSGVGAGRELQQYNIPIQKHLPGVGKNLQDHLVYFALFQSTYKQSLDSAENFPVVVKHLYQYFMGGKQGPFSSNLGEAGAFVKSSPDQPAIDTQYHFAPNYFLEHGFIKPKGNGFSIGGKVLNPKSTGKVSLSSGRFDVAPAIDHNYLSDSDDLRRSIWGYRLGQKLGMSKAFEPYRKGLYLPERCCH